MTKSQVLGMTLYTVEGDPYVTMTTHINAVYDNFKIIDTFASKVNTDIETYGTRLATLSNTVVSVSSKADKNESNISKLSSTVNTLSGKVDSVTSKADKTEEDLESLGLTVVDGLLCVNIS